jgi:lipopolysaccharide export system permease protein
MIFERAARREFAQAAAGISVSLLAILTSTQLIRLLKDAAGGRIAPEAVVSLLGFAALNFMPILLSLTLFVSILLTLSRSLSRLRDGRLVFLRASPDCLDSSGYEVCAADRPGYRGAVWFPVAHGQLQHGRVQGSSSRRAAMCRRFRQAPFREAKQRTGGFSSLRSADDASQVGNVFVASVQEGKLGVVMSNTGIRNRCQWRSFVVLENGRRYEVEPGTPQFKIMEFERYSGASRGW